MYNAEPDRVLLSLMLQPLLGIVSDVTFIVAIGMIHATMMYFHVYIGECSWCIVYVPLLIARFRDASFGLRG